LRPLRRWSNPVKEKRSVFEAFVLSICASWEILVQELLIDCLNQDTSGYATYTGFQVPKHMTRETCKAVLLGVAYLDFKSIGHLKDISKKILIQSCNPFLKIPAKQGQKIDDFFIIRNYLAHRSYAARRALNNVYKNNYGLRNFVAPGSFLLAQDNEEHIARIGMYINNFKNASHHMGRSLGIISCEIALSKIVFP
jgi:hypothetical protein